VTESARSVTARPSKVRKILARTTSGSLLVLALAAALYFTYRSSDGRPIFYTTAIVSIAAAFEIARMGRFADRDLLLVLLAPVLGLLVLEDGTIRGLAEIARYQRDVQPWFPEASSGAYAPNLAIECASAILLALAALGFLRALRALRLDERAVHIAFWLCIGVLAYALRRSAFEVRDWLVLGALPVAIVVVTTMPLVLARPHGIRDAAIAAALAVWLAAPLPALWQVWRDYSFAGLVALLVLSKIGDTAAYYVGSAIGRTHPFPKLSPGKTTAGCVASFATATAIGGLFAMSGVLPSARHGVIGGLCAGAIVNLAAQAGDLLESWVKRRAGVKDSSSVFGPSGGVLDQIDSLLVSVPVAIMTWPWLLGRA
jgi:phosphatidate cytidylyltransferase